MLTALNELILEYLKRFASAILKYVEQIKYVIKKILKCFDDKFCEMLITDKIKQGIKRYNKYRQVNTLTFNNAKIIAIINIVKTQLYKTRINPVDFFCPQQNPQTKYTQGTITNKANINVIS